PDMVEAYKRYRVFLNVNSVKDSPTMLSRRVFELLACGTPVVSTYARGIETLLGDNGVFLVATEAEATRILERLMHDDDAWARASALGIRKVLSEHTYAQRFAEICQRAGLDGPTTKPLGVAVIMPVGAPADFAAAAELLAAQTYSQFETHLFAEQELSPDQLERLSNAARGRPVRYWSRERNGHNRWSGFMETSSAEIVCSLWTDAAYSPDYLEEAALFFRIPKVDFAGKACHFEASDGSLRLVGSDEETCMVASVPSATVCARRSCLKPEDLKVLLTEPVFQRPAGQILSTCRYNFLSRGPGGGSVNGQWRLNG
ncbi:MAG: glycosyltransferase family 1 protein, partial [Planctomycetes bacterium]|nr:glycosyltransferase family 1 protein [Planctomycetota bacterium]